LIVCHPRENGDLYNPRPLAGVFVF